MKQTKTLTKAGNVLYEVTATTQDPTKFILIKHALKEAGATFTTRTAEITDMIKDPASNV